MTKKGCDFCTVRTESLNITNIYLFTAKRFGSVSLVQCLPTVIYLNYNHTDVERRKKYLGSAFLYLFLFLLNVTKRNVWIEMSAFGFIVRSSTYSWLFFLCLCCKLFVIFQTAASNILHSVVSWTCLKNIRFEGLGLSLKVPQNRYLFSLAILTFRGPYIVMYSYNENQRDALFLKFI
jgi:hypothetical protein